MPRKLPVRRSATEEGGRVEYPGPTCHLMNRGDHSEDILKDDSDRERFLCTLSEACAKTEWQVHAKGQRCPGNAASPGNHDELEMDPPTLTDGQLDPRIEPAERQGINA